MTDMNISEVRIKTCATLRGDGTERTWDSIRMVIGDLHMGCDLMSGAGGDRQIRQAFRACNAHGARWIVAPHLQARVDSALARLVDAA